MKLTTIPNAHKILLTPEFFIKHKWVQNPDNNLQFQYGALQLEGSIVKERDNGKHVYGFVLMALPDMFGRKRMKTAQDLIDLWNAIFIDPPIFLVIESQQKNLLEYKLFHDPNRYLLHEKINSALRNTKSGRNH